MKESYGEGLANHTGPESCCECSVCKIIAINSNRRASFL